MRWEGLFADLEGRLAAEERRELDDEVAERTRRERALVELDARLCAAAGPPVRIGLVGGSAVDGELLDVGDGWLLARAGTGAPRGARAHGGGRRPSGRSAAQSDRRALGPAVRARLRATGPVA